MAILGKSVTAIKAHNSAWLDNGFHIFIFGSENYGKFELRAHKYWMFQDKLGGSIKDFKSDVDSFKKCNKEHGIFKKEFDEYANFIFKQKDGAGSSVNLESSALIASIGSKTVVASFVEYCKRMLGLGIDRSIEQKQTIEISQDIGMRLGL